MKNYCKGLVSGLLIAGIICMSIPAIADSIEAALNPIRISVNGMDVAQWGEDYALEDGTSVPYSIVYKGTTYLPMRKLGELLGADVHWNADSSTAYVSESKDSEEEGYVLAEKPDAYGNVWTYYYTSSEKGKYLCVKDKERGYERVYSVAGGGFEDGRYYENIEDNVVYVTDESVIFARYLNDSEGAYLWKIDFLNDVNTQDGERLTGYLDVEGGFDKALFYEDYLFCMGRDQVIYAFNMVTKEMATYDFSAEIKKYTTYHVKWVRNFVVNVSHPNKIEFPLGIRYESPGSSATMQEHRIILHNENGQLYFTKSY